MDNQYDDELSADLEEFDTKKGGVNAIWHWAEEAKVPNEKAEVNNYYANEIRIWRSMRKILKRKYNEHSRRIDTEHPNLQSQVLVDEGYRRCLQDLWQLIPRPRENR